ncbi:hypothetical protein EIP86_009273 [Pleurotus ostreatoroseus]|nr:hypothetical protein EIP86_009273 [Pleurotus ostreatoroseus]
MLHRRSTLLVAILVPVLVTLLVILPCLILLVRWRRRKRVRFMPEYGLAENQPNASYSGHEAYADSVTTTRDGSQYDMVSVPSASMVHAELLQHNPDALPQIPISRGLFSDRDDVRVPLFIETDVPPTTSNRAESIVSSPTSSSRWAFSPTASIAESLHRVRSKLSTRSGTSTQGDSRSHPKPILDPLAPSLFADKSLIRPSADDAFSDVDWHMDDPFANLSAPSEGREGQGDQSRKGSSGHAYTSLLRKLTHKS